MNDDDIAPATMHDSWTEFQDTADAAARKVREAAAKHRDETLLAVQANVTLRLLDGGAEARYTATEVAELVASAMRDARGMTGG